MNAQDALSHSTSKPLSTLPFKNLICCFCNLVNDYMNGQGVNYDVSQKFKDILISILDRFIGILSNEGCPRFNGRF